MRCLADFVVDSDLCLAPNDSPLTLHAPNGSFSLTLSNTDPDHHLPEAVLSAQVVFEADSFNRNLRTVAFDKLNEILNCLTFTTSRKFSPKRLKRIIDWTPGLVERKAIIYVETPEWDRAEPAFDEKFIDSTERFLAMLSGEEQQAAMRWYRLGIQAEGVEDQFSDFWFALEIAAENMKGSKRATSKCPQCRADLFCKNCGDFPTHRPYPGEAIKQAIERVHPQDSDEIFETLQKIRHALLHGGRISSIISELPCNEEQALNKVAFIARQSIILMSSKPDPRPEAPMNLGYSENITRRTIVGGVTVQATMLGDPANPKLADFPAFHFDVMPG